MQAEKYLSQMALKEVFPSGQEKLGEATVVVVGLGGTGSGTAELLARMGLGQLVLVDDDVIEVSNLNRQSLYREEDVGKKKVKAARAELGRINGDVKVEEIDEKINFSNAESIIMKGDITVDGTDNYSARNVINTTSIRLKKPWIFSAVEGTFGYAKAIIPGRTSCLSCFGYPREGEGVSCNAMGLIPPIVRLISSVAASLAIKVILGEEVTGNLLYFDVWKPTFEEMELQRNEDCQVCGRQDDTVA